MHGSNADDVRSRVPLVCLPTLAPATRVFAENPKGFQPPFPLLKKKKKTNPKQPFPGNPHCSAVLVCQAGAQHPWKRLGWGQLWVREWSHTHLSPSSQSDPASADWKHTCKSDRARMFCVLQFICIITVLGAEKLERKSHASAGPAGLKPELSLGICLSGALLWASSNQNQQRTSPRAQ